MNKDGLLRKILHKTAINDSLTKRARLIDIMDALLSMTETYTYNQGVIGMVMSYSLKGIEFYIKYQYFYKYYANNYENPLSIALMISTEFLRVMYPSLNLTAVLPMYYFIAKREE